jgi:hypothetical protein
MIKRAMLRLASSRIALGAVTLTLGLGLMVLFRPSEPPAVLLSVDAARKPSTAFLGRWRGFLPMQIWRLRDAILGPRKAVLFNSTLYEINSFSPADWTEDALGKAALSSTNGLRIWILEKKAFNDLQNRIKQIPEVVMVTSPNVQTAHKIPGQFDVSSSVLIHGTNQYTGVSVSFLPRVRRDAIDLTTAITFTEAVTNAAPGAALSASDYLTVRTNVAAGARLHIPTGSGVLILDAGPPNETRKKHIAFLISAKRM